MKKTMLPPVVGSVMLFLMGVLISSPLSAGPLQEAWIPADIQWGLHWDKEAMDDTVIGRRLQEEMDAFGWQGMMAGFEQEWGFNPWQAMTGLTMYGNQRDCQSVVMIMEGQFNTASITAKLVTKDRHALIPYNAHEIHTWFSGEVCGSKTGQMVYGVFVGKELICLSAGQPALQTALDVIDGKAESLAQTEGISQIRQYSQNSWFIAGADRLNGVIPMHGDRGVMLSHTREVVMSISAAGDQVTLNLLLMLDTDQAALNVAEVLEGMKAFAELSADRKPMLAQLARGMQLDVQGRQLTMSVTADAELLITMMKKLALEAFTFFH